MSEFDPATLPAESCPAPNFTDISKNLQDALCKVDERALARDEALLAEHKKLVNRVAVLDEGNVSDIIITITDFIKGIDKDGNGAVDGLLEIITINEDLKKRVATLEETSKLTTERVTTLSESQQLLRDRVDTNSRDIEALKKREDQVGIDEARAAEIASDIVCKAVLKPLQKASDDFASAISQISCGEQGHASFMASIGGEVVASSVETVVSAAAPVESAPVESEVVVTDVEPSTDVEPVSSAEVEVPEEDNAADDLIG